MYITSFYNSSQRHTLVFTASSSFVQSWDVLCLQYNNDFFPCRDKKIKENDSSNADDNTDNNNPAKQKLCDERATPPKICLFTSFLWHKIYYHFYLNVFFRLVSISAVRVCAHTQKIHNDLYKFAHKIKSK